MRNQTQFRRHAVPPEPGIQPTRQARRFITIHHISSQFRIHAGRRTGAPRNSAPSLEFKTKPAVRRGLEIGFGFQNGCGSFAIETKAQSFHQIDGVLSVPTARIRGDIDTPAGYLVHPRQV